MEELTVGDAFQAYIPTQQAISSGQLLSKLKVADLYYFVMRGTNAIGMAAVRMDEKSGSPIKVTSYRRGSATKMWTGLQIAKQLPQTQMHDFEFRYLDISPLYFRAVWLHGQSDDIILPLPPTYGMWNAYQPYSEPQVVEILKSVIQKRSKLSGKDVGLASNW